MEQLGDGTLAVEAAFALNGRAPLALYLELSTGSIQGLGWSCRASAEDNVLLHQAHSSKSKIFLKAKL